MEQYRALRQFVAMALAAVFTISAAFVSEASSAVLKTAPLTLHLDLNSRQVSIYDGYTSYVMGYRASETDTFSITADKNGIDLDDAVLNYYLITYDGETNKYLECTVNGLDTDTHYPVVRPETAEREKEEGGFYDTIDRCYVVELCYGDTRNTYYFSMYPEDDMDSYRNILLGKWKQDSKGIRYLYQGEYLTSWAQINDKWYLFDLNGYLKTGWQEYEGQWYYLDPDTGVMQSNCIIDGHELDGSGARIS